MSNAEHLPQASAADKGRNELSGRALRGGKLTFLTQAVKLASQTASTILLARYLTPEDYGKIVSVTSVLGIATIFKDLGLSTATIRAKSINQEQISSLFWLNVTLGLVTMVLMFALAPAIAAFYSNQELIPIALTFALIAPVSALGAQHAAVLQRNLNFSTLAKRDILATVTGVLTGFLAAANGLGYWTLIIIPATTTIVSTAALWWRAEWRPSKPKLTTEVRSHINFGFKLSLSNLVGFFTNTLDSLLIGRVFGEASLGSYNRAQMLLSKPLSQVLPPLLSVSLPYLSRIQEDHQKFQDASLKLFATVCMLSSLLVAYIFPNSPTLVTALLGSQWAQSAPIFQALSIFGFTEPCASFIASLLTVKGRSGCLLKWRLISSAIVLAGLALGLPWGPVGVATTYALSGLLVRTPLFISFASNRCGLPKSQLYRTLLPFVMSGFTSAAISFATRSVTDSLSPTPALLLQLLLVTLSYVALISVFPIGRSTATQACKAIALAIRGLGRSATGSP